MSTLKIPVGPDDHMQGDAAAERMLVEYGDYECPHCAHAHEVVERLQKHFGGRLCFVFRNFPLKEIHPEAEPAAETAEFAGAAGKFWEMHGLLFENQEHLESALYEELAEELKLDPAALLDSLDKGEYMARVRADFLGGVRSGVNGTPTFFINGRPHRGLNDYEELAAAIEENSPAG